jgi:hypothetical protein
MLEDLKIILKALRQAASTQVEELYVISQIPFVAVPVLGSPSNI